MNIVANTLLDKPGEVPAQALEYIISGVENMGYGQIVLIAQNFWLIQIECNEKLRSPDFAQKKITKALTESEKTSLARKISSSFENLEYGQLIISVKDGNVFQLERVEKQRFTGLYGEGI